MVSCRRKNNIYNSPYKYPWLPAHGRTAWTETFNLLWMCVQPFLWQTHLPISPTNSTSSHPVCSLHVSWQSSRVNFPSGSTMRVSFQFMHAPLYIKPHRVLVALTKSVGRKFRIVRPRSIHFLAYQLLGRWEIPGVEHFYKSWPIPALRELILM